MTGIQTIKIPGTVESLGGQAFAGCAGLKEVVMEDGTAPLSIKQAHSQDAAVWKNNDSEKSNLRG